MSGRQVPGPQTPFSLNPDPDQNKEDTTFISVLACEFCIPLSLPIQFCPLLNQNFEKNAKDPAKIPELWIQNPKVFCRFSWSSNIFVKDKSCHIKHYTMGNQSQYSERRNTTCFARIDV